MVNNPLVSILIPTYNRPNYFEIALLSAINQTYKNIEIIICDDSDNYLTKQIAEKYMRIYPNIRYYHNGGPLGGFGIKNMHKCYSLASGEFINYLNDDDIFEAHKIERMLEYFYLYDNIKLVTSHRDIIDEHGNVLPEIPSSKRIQKVNVPVAGREAASRMIMKGNFIGEPTTAMFRKKDVVTYGVLEGRQFYALVDIASWLHLLSIGNLVYISDTLSYFRMHKQQNTKKPEISIKIALDAIIINYYAYTKGLIPYQHYQIFLENWVRNTKEYIPAIVSDPKYASYLSFLKTFKII